MSWHNLTTNICITYHETFNFKSYSIILQEAKIFSEKQRGFRDGLSYSTPQKSEETRGNTITQPWSPFRSFVWGLGTEAIAR